MNTELILPAESDTGNIEYKLSLANIDINSSIEEKIKWIEELTYEDFSLKNYKCHNTIKAIMK